MKRLSFLQIHFFYDFYLERFYQGSNAATKPFYSQIDELIRDGFSAVHIISPYLDREQFDARLIVANSPYSQKKWLEEHNPSYDKTSSSLDVLETVRMQIEYYKPDILYLTEPILLDSRFLRTLRHKPTLTIGFRAANISSQTDWSLFDVILSPLQGMRQQALEQGAKSSRKYYPGFPEWIYEEIKHVRPKSDLFFCGQWTQDQHQRRNRLLSRLVESASQIKDERIDVSLYLSHGANSLPQHISAVNGKPIFGIEMHRRMRRSRIVFDAKAKHEVVFPDGQRKDIGGNETANMRIFESTGSGCFLITEFFANLRELFEPGIEIETFSSEEELIDKVRFYLNRPDLREVIARKGMIRCHTDHSVEKRARVFEQLLFEYLK